MTAQEQLNALLADIPQDMFYFEVESYDLKLGTVLIQWLVDNAGDNPEVMRAAVAWDDEASDEGAGACFVEARELGSWLFLNWPAKYQKPGWLWDGSFYYPKFKLGCLTFSNQITIK